MGGRSGSRWGIPVIAAAATLSVAASACLWNAAALAQATKPGFDMVRTENAPKIDGKLDEAVWKNAAVVRDLNQIDPGDGVPPSERTEFRLLYDKDFLYIGVRAYDSEPDKIIARQLSQGKTIRGDDMVQIILDPFLSGRSGYGFFINANGVRREGFFESPDEMNRDWKGIWFGESSIDDKGWVAEYAIPFKTLNFNPDTDEWGATFGRFIPRKNERIAWVSLNRHTNPANTGRMRNINDIEQGVGLDIIPSVSLKRKEVFNPGDVDYSANPSLDIFYKLTPSLTSVLTINSDFSDTVSDDRIVNLSRFSILQPERRDFFLQDVDIFKFSDIRRNGIPYTSRRIGLDADGNPVDILAGLKLSGRIGRWDVGLFDAYLNEQETFGLGRKNVFVGRAAYNLFEESKAGVLFTHGDPNSNRDSYTVGADFQYRDRHLIDGKIFVFDAYAMRAYNEGVDGDDTAFAAGFSLNDDEGWNGFAFYKVINEEFDPALGFVNWSDVAQIISGISHTFRFDKGPIKVWAPELFSFYATDTGGNLESRSVDLIPIRLWTRSGDRFEVKWFTKHEDLEEGFEIVPDLWIPAGNYDFDRTEISYQISPARTLAGMVEVSWGDFYGGDKMSIDGNVTWRINKHFRFEGGYSYNELDLPGGKYITRLTRARLNIAFNSKWSLSNLLEYDNVSEATTVNSRLTWTAMPGREVFLGINHTFGAPSFTKLHSEENLIVLKMRHTFRY